MKVGDIVQTSERDPQRPTSMDDWTGIIVDWDGSDPVVFWNDRFPAELEYKEQLVVVSESR